MIYLPSTYAIIVEYKPAVNNGVTIANTYWALTVPSTALCPLI